MVARLSNRLQIKKNLDLFSILPSATGMDLTNKTKNPRGVRTVKGYLGKKCVDSIHETENIEEERDSSGYRQQ